MDVNVIPPHVILGYALTVRDKITLTELKRMKKKIEALSDDLYIDLNESLIYETAEEYPKRFRVDLEGKEIVIYAKQKFSMLFLAACYSYLFHSYDVYEKAKKIMLAI